MTNTPTPRVSVLVTSYNRERYIAQSIESVLAQTYRDFELVVVDNASTDATVAIAKRYEAVDPRVRVTVNERNIGQFPNRNRAATLARGELFKYHDSDDVMYPHCLKVMVDALDAEPSADFALTSSRSWTGGPAPMLLTPEQCYAREYLGHGMFQLGPPCALFRKAWFEHTGGFGSEGTIADHLFWMRACRTARVVLVAGDLFYYRIHPDQLLQTEDARQAEFALERAAWEGLFDPACPLRGDMLEQARRNRLTGLARRAMRDVIAGDWHAAVTRLRTAKVPMRLWMRYLGRRRFDLLAGTPQLRQS